MVINVILDILRNLSLSKIELLMRILDGCILFFFISIFFTSIIINIKNRNLKSMLISFIFIIIYGLAAGGMFFGLTLLQKMGIPVTNTNYYIAIGIFVAIQIAMIVLMYIFADPYAREKKIEKMKETGEYYRRIREKEEKKQKNLIRKKQRKKQEKPKKLKNKRRKRKHQRKQQKNNKN